MPDVKVEGIELGDVPILVKLKKALGVVALIELAV